MTITSPSAKNRIRSQKPVIYTKEYLDCSVRKLVAKLDLLKVLFNNLEVSFLSESPSEIDLDSADVVAISRKRLHLVIDFTEKLREHKAHCSMEICRAMDNVYRMLSSIKEQISQLDARVANVIIEIESIIEYANVHIRNIVLTINEKKVEDSLTQSFTNSQINSSSKSNMVDTVSDIECQIIYDSGAINRNPNLKLEKSINIEEDYNHATRNEEQENEFHNDVDYGKSPNKSVDDTCDVLDKTLGDYPQSDISSCEDEYEMDSDISEPEILEKGPNGEFPRPRIWNIRKVFKKYKVRLACIKRDIKDML
ncbi:hypothetical protein TSAR_002135 [Trichomalopsis sarcophagae]|uniref:Uncharacterized protein n=1 Tax=Trichomalopsis sarcophagae TaxID=543379 RepID=A0A232F451_9HYME|nr:hypothetical protein TSAR_002135 [Trichomalopsis sarcophagae]